MKKLFFLACLVLFTATANASFLYQVKNLSAEEIKKLSDDELLILYNDAVVERKANEIFYGRAGFTPKEYELYKDLLKLIIRIRQEMTVRGITPPPVEEWLKSY
jgi:hypothetical protein